jgi:hypothetical protein
MPDWIQVQVEQLNPPQTYCSVHTITGQAALRIKHHTS